MPRECIATIGVTLGGDSQPPKIVERAMAAMSYKAKKYKFRTRYNNTSIAGIYKQQGYKSYLFVYPYLCITICSLFNLYKKWLLKNSH